MSELHRRTGSRGGDDKKDDVPLLSGQTLSGIEKIEQAIEQLTTNAQKFRQQIQEDRKLLDTIHHSLTAVKKQLKEYKAKDGDEQERIDSAQKHVRAMSSELIPRTGSVFVRLLLGRINVKHYSTTDQQLLKDEYEKFKLRTSNLFLGFVLVQMATYWISGADAATGPLATLWPVWLLYYYCTLALREHILRVNGSRIMMWWIYHHYLSMAISGTTLLWNTPTFKAFYLQFLVFSAYQGGLQLLLNRYQQSRLYKQRALGKATRIDVAAEHELVADRGGSSYGCAPNLMMLLPAILGAHLFQFYNAATLFSSVYSNWSQQLPVEWQPVLLGIFFLVVAIGNVYSTIEVYYQKWRQSSRPSTQG